eukprot:scaffold6021_cov117-Isochrysis_galbana.AAC.18
MEVEVDHPFPFLYFYNFSLFSFSDGRTDGVAVAAGMRNRSYHSSFTAAYTTHYQRQQHQALLCAAAAGHRPAVLLTAHAPLNDNDR